MGIGEVIGVNTVGSGSSIQLLAGGDVMLGEHPAMVGRGIATALKRRPEYDPFAEIKALVGSADLAIANLESAISDWPRFCRPSSRECRAPSEAIQRVRESGFDAFTIANNHTQQHGEAALRETVDILEDLGIIAVGLATAEPGRCRPVFKNVKESRIALLGYSLRPRQHFSTAPLYAEGTRVGILADIAEQTQDGNMVVVTIHWGDEFITTPSRDQVSLGREMVDAGAKVIIGHHPHVLQSWEEYESGVIAYSLGNLLFDMPWEPHLLRSALMECRLSERGQSTVTWHPTIVDEGYVVRLAKGRIAEAILNGLDRDQTAEHASLKEQFEVDDYEQRLKRAVDENRWARNRYFLSNLHRYRVDVAAELITKFVLRRVGLLRD